MIPAYAILCISAVCVIISFLLFQRAAGSMSVLRLNTISYVFYFQILTTGVVGSILLALGKIDFHYLAEPLSRETKVEAWAWVMYSIITLPIAMNLLNYMFKVRARQEFRDYIRKPAKVTFNDRSQLLILSMMLGVSAFLVAYIAYYTERMPIMTLLSGNMEQAMVDRVSAKSAFHGSDYVKGTFVQTLIPVFSYYGVIIAMQRRKLIFWGLSLALIGLAAFMAIYDTQKAPLAFYLLGFLIIYTLVKGGISPVRFAVILGTGVSAIVLGYVFTTDANFLDQITRYESGFYGRLFISGYMAFPLSLELFPKEFPEAALYLSGIPYPILRFFGVEHIESARLIMMYINPEGVAAGTANLVSGYYMGEAYASYGYIGMIAAPFVVGAVVQVVHIYLLRKPKDPLIMAFYAYLTIKWLLGAGFVSFLYLKIILFPFILYLMVKGGLHMLKRQRA